jgi:hypothetical protein
MVYVYVENGKVKDRVRVDPYEIFTAEYAKRFMGVADEVDFEWTFDGEHFSPPPPVVVSVPTPPAALTKEELLAQLQALQAQIQALE